MKTKVITISAITTTIGDFRVPESYNFFEEGTHNTTERIKLCLEELINNGEVVYTSYGQRLFDVQDRLIIDLTKEGNY